MNIFQNEEVENTKRILVFQILSIFLLGFAAIGVVIIGHFFPTFFPYSYLKWGGWDSVWRFWPLFAWAAFGAIMCSIDSIPIYASQKRALFGYGVATSILAGIWEEIGYRWIFICYAMVSVIVFNFIFGSLLAWVVAGICAGAAVLCLRAKNVLWALAAFAGCALSIWLALHINPLYWIYQYGFLPLIHLTTFHQMDPIIYGKYDAMFIFGAILANMWFRDGHKYQGLPGYINSWYGGLVLLYATLTYGLWTAVVIHMLYDIEFDVVRFLMVRSIEKKKAGKEARAGKLARAEIAPS